MTYDGQPALVCSDGARIEMREPFGQRLRAARLDAGLTATEMASRLNVSRVQVHRIEASQSVTEGTVRRWARALDLRVELQLQPNT